MEFCTAVPTKIVKIADAIIFSFDVTHCLYDLHYTNKK